MKKASLFLTLLLVLAFTTVFSITAYAAETKSASSEDARAVNTDGYTYTKRITGQAFNGRIGGKATVLVAVNVTTSSKIQYQWDSSSTCYAEKTYSGYDYENDIYNPEVCTYSVDLGNQNVSQTGFSETYYPSELDSESIIYPSDHDSALYSYTHDNLRISFPIKVKSNYAFTWSSNVTPAAASFSNTFTLTAP